MFYVGQRVTSNYFGLGTVTKILDHYEYPIWVKFDMKGLHSFTDAGYFTTENALDMNITPYDESIIVLELE